MKSIIDFIVMKRLPSPSLPKKSNIEINNSVWLHSQQQLSIFLVSKHQCAQSSTSISSKLPKNLSPSNSQTLLQYLKLPSTSTSLYLVSMSRMYLRQSMRVLLVAEPKMLGARMLLLLSVSAFSMISERMRFIFQWRTSNLHPNSAKSICFLALSRGRAMRSTRRRLQSYQMSRRTQSRGLFQDIYSEARSFPNVDLP